MAVSGKTTKLEWPYYLGADKPPDLAAVTKAQAERAESLLTGTKGELLIVQSTGAPAAKAMKGDATLAEDGTLTLANAAVTSQKLKPTMGIRVATESPTLPNGEWVDVPGCKLEITPLVASVLLVFISVGIASINLETSITGSIKVDAEAERAAVARVMKLNTLSSPPGAQFYVEPLTAATHTITMRVQASTKSLAFDAANTRMSYMMFAS